MVDLDKINAAATDYTKFILAEYPDAAVGGLAVHVTLYDAAGVPSGDYSVTVTPAALVVPEQQSQVMPPGALPPAPLPAPEELLLHHPDTPVSDEPPSDDGA